MLKIEEMLRKDTFAEGVPIVLGNGEAFHFRPPVFGIYPEVRHGIIVNRIRINYGLEWEKRFNESRDTESNKGNLLFNVWWFADRMLIDNYRAQIRLHYRKLLYFNHKDPETVRRHLQIWDIVKGNDPKGLGSVGL